MGDVGHQFPPQVLHLGELPGGVVEGLGQFARLPVTALVEGDAVIALGQLPGRLVDADDGGGDPPGEEEGQHRREGHQQQADVDELHLQCLGGGAHRGRRCSKRGSPPPRRGGRPPSPKSGSGCCRWCCRGAGYSVRAGRAGWGTCSCRRGSPRRRLRPSSSCTAAGGRRRRGSPPTPRSGRPAGRWCCSPAG